jgi:DNA (cytosine-5)-methyltransferase 1
MIKTQTVKIGSNRGLPRIWIQNKSIEEAGFTKDSTYDIVYNPVQQKITINKSEGGDRKVSGTGKRSAIIDICNSMIRDVFKDNTEVEITISQNRIVISLTKIDRKKSARISNKTMGSVFTGIGGLDEAGKRSGYEAKFAIEKEAQYAEIYENNNSNVEVHNSDIANVEYSKLQKVELLVGGIPCEPFSQVRRNYREGDLPELHENADLSMHFLQLVEHVNPRNIVLEEVPQYLKSGVGTATMNALKRMGYHVVSKTVDGTEYGESTQRKRAVILATTEEIEFPEPVNDKHAKLHELLLPVEDPQCEWWNRETKSWVFEHWETQTAKGNNFASQQLEYGKSETVQAITRRYFAQQGGNPVVKHPDMSDTFRWLTITEVKRIMGYEDDFDLGTAKTTAGEGMGQSVLIDTFAKIIGELK